MEDYGIIKTAVSFAPSVLGWIRIRIARRRALRARLSIRDEFRRDGNLLWRDTATGREGPYCLACRDRQEKEIRLYAFRPRYAPDYFQCPECKNTALDPDGKPKEPRPRRRGIGDNWLVPNR